jgi:uncharacterized protein YeaO (DUF488 family)
MEKQTAVDWLISELKRRILIIESEPDGIVRTTMIDNFLEDIEPAKEMEKQERENSYSDGWNDCEKWFAEKELHEKFGGADII